MYVSKLYDLCMDVRTYGAISCTTETAPETAIPRTTDTETETETDTETGMEPSIYVNIRDFVMSTRIPLFVHVIFSVCLSAYFLEVWSFLYLPIDGSVETGPHLHRRKVDFQEETDKGRRDVNHVVYLHVFDVCIRL